MKFEKRIGSNCAVPIILEARGRMEGAIADRNRNYPYLKKKSEPLSETAEALAAVVGGVCPDDEAL